MMKAFALFLFSTISLQLAYAETVKDREGAVRQDRAALENDPRWIYNDFQRGFDQARQTGRPLLVVLRCVPCLACAGLDAQVLEEPELLPLLDQFVRVRVINANTLDLSRFQFDYDLSFSTIFFNGDGTVYGRYGSWTHQKEPTDKTTAGYKRALEAALAIHRGYPGNKVALAGKQGSALPFKTSLDLPQLAGKYRPELDWNGKVVQSCVHCHQIGDGLRADYRAKGKTIPLEWIYPWPAPETIGVSLASDDTARVQSVTPDSPAAKAGIVPGDSFLTLGGQPLVSIADVSWVLHHAPEQGSLQATVQHGSAQQSVTMELPAGWRSKVDISRRVGTWPMRAMALGGLVLEDLGNEERTRRNLKSDGLALLVKHAGEYGEHAAAKKAGFRKDDVLVAVDAVTRRTTESQLLGELLQNHRPGEKVKTTVLRGDERIELSLPMQ